MTDLRARPEQRTRETAGHASHGDPLWHSKLIFGKDKAPKAILANAITALREAPQFAGLLWFDVFRQRPMIRGQAPWMREAVDQEWIPEHDLHTADWLQHHGINVSPDITVQAVEVVSRERLFHPILDYLKRCESGGVRRLDTWMIDYLGAADTHFVRAASVRWLISAVARIFEPGCRADHVLILEGPQGILKSTALKTLGHPWFTDEVAELGTKDAAMQLAGRWIIELAELDSMSRGEVSRIKAFISRSADRYRPPYGKRVIEFHRQCVFAGTTNQRTYLRDETGGRRFWPVECGKIDIDGLAQVRDQLWGEARHRYETGESWWFDSTETGLIAAAEDEQQMRYQADPWQDKIADFLEDKSETSVSRILEQVLFVPPDRWTKSMQTRVGQCLTALGWRRQEKRLGGNKVRVYVRPS
jgi:predicted P-loop ATPase